MEADMMVIDLSGYDDPSTTDVNEAEATIASVVFHHLAPDEEVVSGTGLYVPFLRQDANGTSIGYNSDETGNPLDTNSAHSSALMLAEVPIIYRDGVAYYEFRLDVNEPEGDAALVALERLEIYASTAQATLAAYSAGVDAFGAGFTKVFDLDDGEDRRIDLIGDAAGSGRDDYVVYVPYTAFGSADPAETFVTFFSQFGPNPAENSGFEEWRTQAVAEIDGIKFADVNGDGIQNNGEGGLAGFTLYLDANDNGVFDTGEISTVSGADGSFHFYGLPVGDDPATVVIRELMSGEQLEDYLLTTGDESGAHAVTYSSAGEVAVAVGNMPIIKDFTIAKDMVSITGATDGKADSPGDVIHYLITIANSGNVALTGLTLSDPLADAGSIALLSGDTDNDSALDVGESWIFSAQHTVTQADLDANPDGIFTNVATAEAHYLTALVGPKSDPADAPLAYNPALTVEKSVSLVEGGTPAGEADSAGDVIRYTIAVANSGNITLTDISVTDPDADSGSIAYVSGDDDNDDFLDVGETWLYTAAHTVTQDELDARGDGTGNFVNVATADSAESDPDSDDASVPLVYDPSVDLEKWVSVDGINFFDADSPTGPIADLVAPVTFRITVENTGNVTLTGLELTDTLTDLSGATLYLDANHNNLQDDGDIVVTELAPGEQGILFYTMPFEAGQHVNVATVTTAEGATASDAAHYFGLVNDGPGVRTPGFWSNLGAGFWDGKDGLPKQAGKPGFADRELLYAVDSNGNGAVDAGDQKGFLIGDYNLDGITNAGEDTIFVALALAQQLIDASQKDQQDGRWMLGRDVVATWLNYLAGNNIGDADDPMSPTSLLNDAIDWFQTFADANHDDIMDLAKAGAIKTNSASWNQPGDAGYGDYIAAATLHSELDQYNNIGSTSGGSYAGDADSLAFLFALNQL